MQNSLELPSMREQWINITCACFFKEGHHSELQFLRNKNDFSYLFHCGNTTNTANSSKLYCNIWSTYEEIQHFRQADGTKSYVLEMWNFDFLFSNCCISAPVYALNWAIHWNDRFPKPKAAAKKWDCEKPIWSLHTTTFDLSVVVAPTSHHQHRWRILLTPDLQHGFAECVWT